MWDDGAHRRGIPSFCAAENSPVEEDGFELAVPPRRERLWAATPGKYCRFGPEPVSGFAFRAAVSDWQRPEETFAGAGPMVRIRFPPAESQAKSMRGLMAREFRLGSIRPCQFLALLLQARHDERAAFISTSIQWRSTGSL